MASRVNIFLTCFINVIFYYIQEINTSSGQYFENMFYYCKSLKKLHKLNISSAVGECELYNIFPLTDIIFGCNNLMINPNEFPY